MKEKFLVKEKTTKRQNDKTTKRHNDKTTKRQTSGFLGSTLDRKANSRYLLFSNFTAFGNFSRDALVRKVMVHARADEAMAMLIDTDAGDLDNGIVFSVVGCLINIDADPMCNRIFMPNDPSMMEYNVVKKLIRILRKSGLKDISLSTVIFKVFSNLAFSCGGVGEKFLSCFFDKSNLDLLSDTLEELLDIATDAQEAALADSTGDLGDKKYIAFLETGTPLFNTVREAKSLYRKRNNGNSGVGEVEEDEEDKEESKSGGHI